MPANKRRAHKLKSATEKRKSKKYNAMKGALASARVGLRNLAVWHSHSTESEYTAELVNLKSCSTIPVGTSTVFAITKIRHLWQVLLLAIGEDDNGKKYFKVDPVQVVNEMYQSDLAEYLDARHKDFVAKSFNKNHLTNVAWIAIPNGFEADNITDQQIDNLITAKGAW